MSNSKCRLFREGDEAGILDLYRTVFGLDMSMENWCWLYQDIPGGPAVIAIAEGDDGRIVGHYGVQPRPFSMGGQRCMAGLAIGTMVAPQYRNLTTLVELARLAYEACIDRQMEFLYAFPNDHIWPVRKAVLGWEALPRIVELEVQGSHFEVPVTGSSRAMMLPSLECFPRLTWLAECSRSEGMVPFRDPDWINWRFAGKPSAEYQTYLSGESGNILGYVVLKRFRSDDEVLHGHIVDWRVAKGREDDIGCVLLSAAHNVFRKWKVDRVSLWLNHGSPFWPLVLEAGFSPTGHGKNFGYLALNRGSRSSIANSSHWEITMADSDVY